MTYGVSAVTVGLLVASAAFACVPNYRDTVTKCVVNDADGGLWTEAILESGVDSPDRCPYNIANFRTGLQTFAGYISGSPYYVDNASTAVINIYARILDGFLVAGPRYFFFSGYPPQSQPSVSYTAGTGGNIADEGGKDVGRVDVLTYNAGFATGVADLTYSYWVYTSIATLGSARPGSVTISSSIANYRSPVAYAWWRNRVRLTNTTSGFTTTLSAGKYTFKVTAKDADGDSGSVSKTIMVAESCTTPGSPTTCPK